MALAHSVATVILAVVCFSFLAQNKIKLLSTRVSANREAVEEFLLILLYITSLFSSYFHIFISSKLSYFKSS